MISFQILFDPYPIKKNPLNSFGICSDKQTILTIQNHVITKNHRISILHSEHKTWQLKIKDIRESDRGFYMCQMNTDPMKSQTGYLDVVGKNFVIFLFFLLKWNWYEICVIHIFLLMLCTNIKQNEQTFLTEFVFRRFILVQKFFRYFIQFGMVEFLLMNFDSPNQYWLISYFVYRIRPVSTYIHMKIRNRLEYK